MSTFGAVDTVVPNMHVRYDNCMITYFNCKYQSTNSLKNEKKTFSLDSVQFLFSPISI